LDGNEVGAVKVSKNIYHNHDFDTSIHQLTENSHSWQSDLSKNVIVRERTIKLPETHIFTPIKETNPVAREIHSSFDTINNLDDKVVRSEAIKEYHDVEYKSPEANNHVNHVGIADYSALNFDMHESSTVIENNFAKVKVHKNSDFSSSKNGKIDNDFDDFAEFQTFQQAPLSVDNSKNNTATPANDKNKSHDKSITLSPTHLMYNNNNNNRNGNLGNQKSDFSISNDFYNMMQNHQNSSIMKPQQNQQTSNEDDEWSDFVGVAHNVNNRAFPASSTAAALSAAPLPQSNHNQITNNDDWTDFVSVPVENSVAKNPSQFLAKPNFSSWNQPVNKSLYPYNGTSNYVETSFLSSNPLPNHASSIYNHHNSHNHHHHQQQMPNGISTILPDLQFSMPKTVFNMQRGRNATDSNKK
jgi:hypothetical protein